MAFVTLKSNPSMRPIALRMSGGRPNGSSIIGTTRYTANTSAQIFITAYTGGKWYFNSTRRPTRTKPNSEYHAYLIHHGMLLNGI